MSGQILFPHHKPSPEILPGSLCMRKHQAQRLGSWGKSFHGFWLSQPLIFSDPNFMGFSFPKQSEPHVPSTSLGFVLKEDVAITLPEQKNKPYSSPVGWAQIQHEQTWLRDTRRSKGARPWLGTFPPKLLCHSSKYSLRGDATSRAGPLWAHQASCISSAHLQTDSGGNGLDPRHVQEPLHLEGEESPVCSCRLWRH